MKLIVKNSTGKEISFLTQSDELIIKYEDNATDKFVSLRAEKLITSARSKDIELFYEKAISDNAYLYILEHDGIELVTLLRTNVTETSYSIILSTDKRLLEVVNFVIIKG